MSLLYLALIVFLFGCVAGEGSSKPTKTTVIVLATAGVLGFVALGVAIGFFIRRRMIASQPTFRRLDLIEEEEDQELGNDDQ